MVLTCLFRSLDSLAAETTIDRKEMEEDRKRREREGKKPTKSKARKCIFGKKKIVRRKENELI